MRLVHSIFEGDDPTPTLTHVFYGQTEDEARGILAVHARYDAFLRAALTSGNFQGIPLRSVIELYET